MVERTLTIAELARAAKEKRLLEAFSCGTAAVISPVSEAAPLAAPGACLHHPAAPVTNSGARHTPIEQSNHWTVWLVCGGTVIGLFDRWCVAPSLA